MTANITLRYSLPANYLRQTFSEQTHRRAVRKAETVPTVSFVNKPLLPIGSRLAEKCKTKKNTQDAVRCLRQRSATLQSHLFAILHVKNLYFFGRFFPLSIHE